MEGVAWYDIKGKGWLRDFLIILHPPYTLWHLSYVPIGAVLAPDLDWATLGWTVLAFFLGMGIGGHCLDELNGRPLRTKLPGGMLWSLAVASILGAVSIGIFIGMKENIWVLPCIIFGGFIVFAYNMEWPSARMKTAPVWSIAHTPLAHLPEGFFHRDIWFGVAWGAFPVITAYAAQTHTLSWAAAGMGLFALLYSMAQRKLSLQARFWRRKVAFIFGSYVLNGQPIVSKGHDLTKEAIIGPADLALKYMTWAVVSVAAGLLLMNI